MKLCTKCENELPIENFSKDKNSMDGLQYYCKSCHKKCYESWKASDPEKARKILKNSDNKWKKNNPEKRTLAAAKWDKANPDKRAATEAKRRASKLQRTPRWLTQNQLEDIQEFYTQCKELQWLSDPTDPLSVDHIIPLQGKNVSGLHVPWNLQILPKSLNSSKKNGMKNVR